MRSTGRLAKHRCFAVELLQLFYSGCKMNSIAVIVSLLIMASCPVSASAAFYRYYDEAGGVNVTNDPNSIPERFRANSTVITEKELESRARSRDRQQRTEVNRAAENQRQQLHKSPAIQSVPASLDPPPVSTAAKKEPVASPENSSGWFSRQLPLLKISAIIALLVAGVVYAGRLVSAFAPRPLAIVIRIAMFAALSVYIFKGFSSKVVEAFSRIKEESSVAQKAVDKRSERIQQQAE